MSAPPLEVRRGSDRVSNRVAVRDRYGLTYRLTSDEAQKLSNDLQDEVDRLAGQGQ